jgi:tetratricopeptide (TPR) repeat protein
MKSRNPILLSVAICASVLSHTGSKAVAAAPNAVGKTIKCIDDAKLSLGGEFESFHYCFFRNQNGRLRLTAVDQQNLAIYDGSLSVDAALAILANPAASILHKTLLNEAGEGLEKLRIEELNALKDSSYRSEFSQNSLVALNPGAIGKMIDKSKAFSRLGYRDLAISSHEKLLAAYDQKIEKRKGKPLSMDDQWEWFSLRSSYLNVRMANGDVDQAIAGYELLAKDGRIYSEYRINAKVNLAAGYAEQGQFADALNMINEAKREFDGFQEDPQDYKLTGSDRHFAWIKACALHGLGKSEEAKPLISFVLSAPEKPVDQYADVYFTSSIERRLYACMGDVDRMADSFYGLKISPLYGHPASLVLQPELVTTKPGYNAYLKKLREHPKMKAAASSFIILPSTLISALNGWK